MLILNLSTTFVSSRLQPSDQMNKANYSIESRPTVKQLNALTSQGILYVLVNKELNTIYVHEYNQQNRYKQFSICARQTTGRPGVNGN